MSKHISRKQQKVLWKEAFEKRTKNVSEISKQKGLRTAEKIVKKINESKTPVKPIPSAQPPKKREIITRVPKRPANVVNNKLDEFEKEYQTFIANLKAEQAKKQETKIKEEVKKPIVVEVPKVEPEVVEEPILAPEQSFVETEVLETVEPITVEVVEETPVIEETVPVVEEVPTIEETPIIPSEQSDDETKKTKNKRKSRKKKNVEETTEE